MAACNWCGRRASVNKYGYCEPCNQTVRDDIVRNKDILDSLLPKAASAISPDEKSRIRDAAVAAHNSLCNYKSREVPFLKSDVDAPFRAVMEALNGKPTNYKPAFKPLKLCGNKTLVLNENSVKIIRSESILAAKREKSIPLSAVAGVEVKRNGALFVGFIQIQTAGQVSGNSSFTYTGGAYDAVQDENAVVFHDDASYAVAMQIKNYIESYSSAPRSQTIVQHSTTAADELLKFKALLDSGAITQAEFDAKKQQLLGL